MTHERRKSDSVIVAEKPANKADKLAVEQSAAEATAAESVEPRAETKENAEQQSTCRTQGRESVSQALDRIRRIARTRKQEQFTALLHHISVELLEEAFLELKMKAAAGVDGLTWDAYEADFDRRIEDLHARVHSGAYRALPSRRVYIPKPDGRQRPLAITHTRRTALLANQPLGSAEVTHPFHPLRGQRFVVLKVRRVSGVETLSLRHVELGSFAVPRERTEWGALDGQAAPTGGQPLLIDAFGLSALTELVTLLTGTVGLTDDSSSESIGLLS